jgi:predicted transport protein
MVDRLLGIVREFDPALEVKYNKFYVGLAKDGQPHNFIVMRPRKSTLMLTIRLPQSAEIQAKLDASGLDVVDFDRREGGYRLRLGTNDVEDRGEVVRGLVEMAYRRQVE